MDNIQFSNLTQERIEKIKTVLCQKAKEYAQSDRLHNFKVAARMNDVEPEQALWGMLTKHLVSVMDMVQGRLEITDERIDEKLGDCINYFILLEALMTERYNDEACDCFVESDTAAALRRLEKEAKRLGMIKKGGKK